MASRFQKHEDLQQYDAVGSEVAPFFGLLNGFRCEYTSEILDDGDEPSFVVTCWEERLNPIVIARPTASGAWAEVGKRFFELKKVPFFVSGAYALSRKSLGRTLTLSFLGQVFILPSR